MTQVRKSDGSLPDIAFMHLVSGSDLIDAGTNVGSPYNGTAPDLYVLNLADPSRTRRPLHIAYSHGRQHASLLELDRLVWRDQLQREAGDGQRRAIHNRCQSGHNQLRQHRLG